MFRKDKLFPLGWGFLLFVIAVILWMPGHEAMIPEWVAEENGLVEDLQMFWLMGGLVFCYKMTKVKLQDWGGNQKALWYAGILFFFEMIMREISWGRTFFHHEDGSIYEYTDMGLYGQLVHPIVGVIIVAFIYFAYKSKFWNYLLKAKLPISSFALLLIYVAVVYFMETDKLHLFCGGELGEIAAELGEELAEFGAYMMMYYIIRDTKKELE